jgi:hypothetical protein
MVEYSPEEENKERLLLERYHLLLQEKALNEQKRREEKERREKLREDLFPRTTKEGENDDREEDDFGLPISPSTGNNTNTNSSSSSATQPLSTSSQQQSSNLSSSQSAKKVNFASGSHEAASSANNAPKLDVPVNKAGFLKKYGKPSELIQSPKKRFFILGVFGALLFYCIFVIFRFRDFLSFSSSLSCYLACFLCSSSSFCSHVLDVKSRSLAYYEKPKAKGEVGSPIGMIPLAAVSQPAQVCPEYKNTKLELFRNPILLFFFFADLFLL